MMVPPKVSLSTIAQQSRGSAVLVLLCVEPVRRNPGESRMTFVSMALTLEPHGT
jgi:hypothetical protein